MFTAFKVDGKQRFKNKRKPRCPHCGTNYRLDAPGAGVQEVECRSCRKAFEFTGHQEWRYTSEVPSYD